MSQVQIARGRQNQIAIAFRAGRKAAVENPGKMRIEIDNPYSERGMMPASMFSVQSALWHAFASGVLREQNKIADAATMLRNARFCMPRGCRS